VATAFGLAGTVGYIGGLGFILIVGYVTASFGYAPLFTAIAFLDLIGAALVWVLIRAPDAAAGMRGFPVLTPFPDSQIQKR
jgi:MFS transporter, ACS family, hexuronate transporter